MVFQRCEWLLTSINIWSTHCQTLIKVSFPPENSAGVAVHTCLKFRSESEHIKKRMQKTWRTNLLVALTQCRHLVQRVEFVEETPHGILVGKNTIDCNFRTAVPPITARTPAVNFVVGMIREQQHLKRSGSCQTKPEASLKRLKSEHGQQNTGFAGDANEFLQTHLMQDSSFNTSSDDFVREPEHHICKKTELGCKKEAGALLAIRRKEAVTPVVSGQVYSNSAGTSLVLE